MIGERAALLASESEWRKFRWLKVYWGGDFDCARSREGGSHDGEPQLIVGDGRQPRRCHSTARALTRSSTKPAWTRR